MKDKTLPVLISSMFLLIVSLSFIASSTTTFEIRTMPEYNHSIIFTISDSFKKETIKVFNTYSNFEKELIFTEDLASSMTDLYFSARSGTLTVLSKRYYNQSSGQVIELDPLGIAESEALASEERASQVLTANTIADNIENTILENTENSTGQESNLGENSFDLKNFRFKEQSFYMWLIYALGFLIIIVVLIYIIRAIKKHQKSSVGTEKKSENIILDNQGKVTSSNMESKLIEAEKKIREAQEVINSISQKRQKIIEAEKKYEQAKKELEEAEKEEAEKAF